MSSDPSDSKEVGDLHPIELVAHFLLSDSLENLHDTFLRLHESQCLLLNRLLVLEDKLNGQLELAKKLEFDLDDLGLANTRIKALSKKLNETRDIFVSIERRLQVLEDQRGTDLPNGSMTGEN